MVINKSTTYPIDDISQDLPVLEPVMMIVFPFKSVFPLKIAVEYFIYNLKIIYAAPVRPRVVINSMVEHVAWIFF